MFKLYHHPVVPFARKVRLVLAEKDVPFEAILEKPWEKRPEFLALNPVGEVPVLVQESAPRFALADGQAICEYLDETIGKMPLLASDPLQRAEIRRICAWFDGKFFRDVVVNLVGEKAVKRLAGDGTPDSNALRRGFDNIHQYLGAMSDLIERRNWLAGEKFSLADITSAAHISVVDYLGDVPWADYPPVKDWYVRIKSRPSFRPLLADHIAGLPPPRHYADLDF